jgi:hypothetical protein
VKSTEFSQEEYLQTFSNEAAEEESGGDYFETLTVGIQELPDNISPSSCQTDSFWDIKKVEEFWSNITSDLKGIRSKDIAISWGNIPMAKYSVFLYSNNEIIYNLAILFALHGNKVIKLGYVAAEVSVV